MKIAIVTGASSGMGAEFAKRLDETERYDEIWLIARRADRLEELGKKLRAKPVILPLDLLKSESFTLLADKLAAQKPTVQTLVCAGGFGRFGKIESLTLDEQTEMIDLNAKALMKTTYLCIPYLESGSEIYELGSLSAFQPVPGIGVYGATKAFVLSFSRALNREWKNRGIRVMAVCPGWVKTEFFNRAVTDDTVTYYNRYYTAEQVVSRALRDMKKGKDVSICGAQVRGQVLLTKLLPHRFVMWVWCRQQKME